MQDILPDTPDLSWLRKTAKSRLRAWKAGGREAKLADAYLSLARDYGYPSWRALKAEIEARTAPLAARFLRAVGEGDAVTVRQMLEHTPVLVNTPGPHPFWGGVPHPLHVAIDTNREDMFRLLMAHGADPNPPSRGYDNWSPLMLAVQKSRDGMAEALRASGAQVGLLEALLMADDALTRELLADGIPLAAEACPSGTLLGLARSVFAVDRLLALGVRTDVPDRWGSTALDALSRLGPKGAPLLKRMAAQGAVLRAQDLARTGDLAALEAMAADDPAAILGDETLMAAVDFGHQALARWLLEQGADPNARTGPPSGHTALHSAAWNGDTEMVRLLLAAGADKHLLDDEHENTPQGWAEVARTVTNNPACAEVAALLAGHTG